MYNLAIAKIKLEKIAVIDIDNELISLINDL
jgi:hypothetical protein